MWFLNSVIALYVITFAPVFQQQKDTTLFQFLPHSLHGWISWSICLLDMLVSISLLPILHNFSPHSLHDHYDWFICDFQYQFLPILNIFFHTHCMGEFYHHYDCLICDFNITFCLKYTITFSTFMFLERINYNVIP